jgi:energy-coupling factor transport system permease protein
VNVAISPHAGPVTAAPAAVTRRTSWHPAAWILWSSFAGLCAFVTTDPVYLLLLWAVAWFVYTRHRVSEPAAASFRMFLIAGIVTLVLRTTLVVFGTVDASSIAYAALEGLRLATILIIFGTFNAVTDPFGVVRLAPRRFHEPALAAALALSISPRMVSAVQRVREAQRLRGIRIAPLRSLPALAVPVLETGMEEAVTLAESMDARGHGRGTRTRYRPQRWTRGTVLVVVAAAAAFGLFLSASIGGWAELHPSTAPLAWPEAHPVLLVAIALLAVPGFMRPGSRAPATEGAP